MDQDNPDIKIELNLIALASSDTSKGNFVVVFEEAQGFRRLPIIIGHFEAQAIAIPLEKMQPTRPLTHDLFKNTLELLEVKILEVIISNIKDQVFFATIVGTTKEGKPLKVDSRASDAIAMAIRFGCPIYTYNSIMEEASILLDSPSKAFTNKRGRLSEYSLHELKQMLAQVLAKEDYESATRIRDAIAKKESGET